MPEQDTNGPEALSEHSKSVARGSFWSLFGNVAFKLVSFAYIVIVARLAAQDDVGIFYLALSIASIASFISEFGILGSLTRYVPYFEGKGEFRKIRDLLNFSYLSVVPAFIMAALLFLGANLIADFYQNPKLATAMDIFAVFVALNGIFKVVSSFLNGRADMKSAQFISNVENLSKLVFTVILFYLYGPSLFMLCAAFALSYIPPLIISYWMMKNHLSKIPATGDPLPTSQLLHEIIPFGFMLSLLGSFSILLSSVDRIFLGFLIPPTESARLLALYSMAANLAIVIMIFPASVGSIFLPVISRLFGKNDKEGIRSLMETSQRWMLFITLPIGLVMILFPSELLSLIYGSDYAAGGVVLALLTLAMMVQSYSSIVSLVIAGARRVDIELKCMGISGVANLILTPLMIYLFGFTGAAAALAISLLILTLLFLHYGKKLFGFSIPKESYKLALAMILSAIIVFMIKPAAMSIVPLLPKIGTGELAAYSGKIASLIFIGLLTTLAFCIFVPASLLLKCIKKEDILLMRSILRKAFVPEQLISLAERIAKYGVAG